MYNLRNVNTNYNKYIHIKFQIIIVNSLIIKQNIYNIYGKCYDRRTSELFREKFIFRHIQSKRELVSFHLSIILFQMSI